MAQLVIVRPHAHVIMTYAIFFAGAGTAILSALIGAWAGSRLNFGFQQRLLKQQLEFQKALLDQQLAADQKSHEEFLKSFDKGVNSEAQGGFTTRTVIQGKLEAIEKAILSLKP
jgi:hypothetical protein